MKRSFFRFTIFACSLLFLGDALAADLTTSVGIPLGASPAVIRQKMTARGKARLVSESSDRIVFKGGSLASFPVRSWVFQFKNGKLSELKVSFSVRQGRNAKGYLADQEFARLRGTLEQSNGACRRETSKTFESAIWKVSSPAQTVKLYHGWKSGVAGSSFMELTFQSGNRFLWWG